MYDERLVRKINQGRAFALLGSGPSNEVGYPSWSRLATEVLEELKRGGKLTDEASYQKYLTENRYPELLSQAERDSGSRSHLVGIISALLRPSPRSRGYIYEILANWPFCCYLTTNWDNEIDWHLRQKNLYFHTLLNGKEDLAQIRHDASQLIVKLHSDLSCEDRVVITSGDYANLMGTAGQYFRDKLKSIFEMFDVLVVGHSLSDPDLRLILQVARETASPEHPIFLIAADLTRSEVREYLERFNIVAMTYDNPDGKHSQLRRVLSLLDKFIIPRQKRFDLNAIRYSPEELEAVQAVALYRRLASAGESELSPILYLGPLILRALQDQTGVVSTSQLSTLSPLSLAIKTEGVQIQVPAALEALRKNGFIEEVGAGFKLSTAGLARAAEISQRRSTEEEQAYGQFSLDLQSLHCPISSAELSAMVHLLQDTLVKVFKQRGLSIANVIFAGQSLRHDALSDMFSAISSAATEIPTPDLGIAFMEASQKFLLNPTEPQKRYLTSTSQGFFLYHLFGLDPSCAKIRRDVFRHAIWWCDSSSLIPLLAQGSANYDYAVDLFTRLQKLSAYTLTTGRLVREVEEHLSWAIRLFENEPLQSPAVLEAATQKAGYKQNLFLDGYVRLSAEGKVSKFHDYIDLVAPYGPTEAGVRKRLGDMAVRVVNADQLEGFQGTDIREIFELVDEITREREKSATLRSTLQVEAEAEILQVIRRLKDGKYKAPVPGMELEHAYFLSQSRILDRIPPADPISWTPEVLYRYIVSLPGEKLETDLLHRCMVQEYFGAGVEVVDKARYERFFGPSIDAANTTYKEERDKYLSEFSHASAGELDTAYQLTPDLEKPFFAQQMGWRVAAKEKARATDLRILADFEKKKAQVAEQELAKLKLERDAKWRKRQEVRKQQQLAEDRQASDVNHQRKRRRQAKKRRRKRK